jgi:hypothetical protein
MAAIHQPWLRLWSDMPNDPKWRTISKSSKQSIASVMAVYLHIIVSASNATERGRTHDVCNEDVASALDLECEQVDAIVNAMQGRVLDGDHVSGWDKRQPSREDGSAERSKAWRESKKTVNQGETGNSEGNKTEPNAAERNQPTEKRREEEIREEKNTQTPRTLVNEPSTSATKAGAVCVVLKSEGIPSVNPSHPELLALLANGAEVGQFAGAAKMALSKNKHEFAYVLGIVRRQMESAAVIAATPMAVPAAIAVTVPGRQGVDPTLAKLDAEALVPRKGPSAEDRARMAELLKPVSV